MREAETELLKQFPRRRIFRMMTGEQRVHGERLESKRDHRARRFFGQAPPPLSAP
jgi:hypothetical protein